MSEICPITQTRRLRLMLSETFMSNTVCTFYTIVALCSFYVVFSLPRCVVCEVSDVIQCCSVETTCCAAPTFLTLSSRQLSAVVHSSLSPSVPLTLAHCSVSPLFDILCCTPPTFLTFSLQVYGVLVFCRSLLLFSLYLRTSSLLRCFRRS